MSASRGNRYAAINGCQINVKLAQTTLFLFSGRHGVFETMTTSKPYLIKNKSLLIILAALSLSGCMPGTMEARFKLDPLRIDKFYATSYDGEVRRLYERILANPKGNRDDDVKLSYAPPRVLTFRRGERICFAVHAFPGGTYRYRYPYSDPTDPISHRLTGFGRIVIRGSNIKAKISGGSIGSIGFHRRPAWQASCVVTPDVRMRSVGWNQYYENPSRWRWNNTLPPGSYTAVITIKEGRPTNRSHTLRTTFVVK